MPRFLRPLGLVILLALGAGAALAIDSSPTTGTVSACATAQTPDQTVQVNGKRIYTITGDTAVNCTTVTYTIPTVTASTPASTTVPATTTPTVTSNVTTTTVQQPATMSNSLQAGATISGTYDWTVTTSGDVAAVEFWATQNGVNRKLATVTGNGSYVYHFDTSTLADGSWQFGVVEVDSAGNRYPDQDRRWATIQNAAGTVTWRGDYETGDWSQFGGAGNLQCTVGTATVEQTVVHQGGYAARYSTPAYDGTNRSRCQQMRNPDASYGNKGEENWFGFSFMVAPGSVLAAGGWNNIVSFHHSNTQNTLIAPDHFAIDNENGVWTLYLTAYGGAWNNNGSIQYRQSWLLGSVQAGQWFDIVYHVKWSDDPNVGYVEVWVNGQQVVPLTHCATLYTSQGSSDNESIYLKVGYDGGGAAASTTVYQDAAVQATDYSSASSEFNH